MRWASYFLFRWYQMPYELNGNCVTVVTAEGYSGQLLISGFARLFHRIVYRSGLHRVTLPGISFINIRCPSRLEENSIKWFW